MRQNLPVTQREVPFRDGATIISITDLKGKITYVNNYFVEISGYEEGELVGAPHNLLRHPDMPPAAFKNLWDTIQKGEAWRGIVKNRCKNGDHYWVDAYVTPVYEHGKIVSYQSVRTKPTRDQVDGAEKLYAKVGMDPSTELPSQWRLMDVSLKPRIFLPLLFLGLLTFLVPFLGINESNWLNGELDSHAKEITKLQQTWQTFADANKEKAGAELEAVTAQINKLVQTTNKSSGHLAEMKNGVAQTSIIIVSICAIGAISLAIIGWLLIRTLVKPMEQVIHICKNMASGDLTENILIPNNDEVGQMLQAVKLLQARLSTVIGRFQEEGSKLSAASTQLSANGALTAEVMAKQQDETSHVATAMNEMAATVQEVAKNTAVAADSAREAESASGEGVQVVNQMRTAISSLVNEVTQAAEVINKLEQQSGDISTITDTISGIAEQTNLLALNAAIEAARAGEQGRGFAVVADEVRTLAARVQESTQEIRSMIDQLHVGIGDAVKVMEQGQDRASQAITEANNTETTLGEIGQAIQNISDLNTQVATAAEEQSSVAEEMNRNVVSINDLSNTTSQGAQEIGESGANLAEMAKRFQSQLAQFKT
jgi:aerotaxis receptor